MLHAGLTHLTKELCSQVCSSMPAARKPTDSGQVHQQHGVPSNADIHGQVQNLSQGFESNLHAADKATAMHQPAVLQSVGRKRASGGDFLLAEQTKKQKRVIKSGELSRRCDVQQDSGPGKLGERIAGDMERSSVGVDSEDGHHSQLEEANLAGRQADRLPAKEECKAASQMDGKETTEPRVHVVHGEKCDPLTTIGASCMGPGRPRCSTLSKVLEKDEFTDIKERLQKYLPQHGPEIVAQQSTAIAQDTGFPLSLHVRGFGSPWEEEKGKELELPESPVTPPAKDDSSPENNLPFFLDHKLPTPDINNLGCPAPADPISAAPTLQGIQVKEEPIEDAMVGPVDDPPKESPNLQGVLPSTQVSVHKPPTGKEADSPTFCDWGRSGPLRGKESKPKDKLKPVVEQLRRNDKVGACKQTPIPSTVKCTHSVPHGERVDDLPPHLTKRFLQDAHHPCGKAVGEDASRGSNRQGTDMLGSHSGNQPLNPPNNPLLPPHLSSRPSGFGAPPNQGCHKGKQDLPSGTSSKVVHTSWQHPSQENSDSSDEILRFSSVEKHKGCAKSPNKGKQDLPSRTSSKVVHTSWPYPSQEHSDSSDEVLRFSSVQKPKGCAESASRKKQELPLGTSSKLLHKSWQHPSQDNSDSSDEVLRFSSVQQPKSYSKSPPRPSSSWRNKSPWQRGRHHSSHCPERHPRSTSCRGRSGPIPHPPHSQWPSSSRYINSRLALCSVGSIAFQVHALCVP